MAYNLNFPLAVDFMRDSQPLMLENYASVFGFIGADHVAFNNGADSGKHNQVTSPLSATDPDDQEMWILYNKMSSFSNIIQLFVKTALNDVNGFSDFRINAQNTGLPSWVQLPSGVIIKWQNSPSISQDLPGGNTHNWTNNSLSKPFTQQFWAAVFPGQSTDKAIAYVDNISTPSFVHYHMYIQAGNTIGNLPSGGVSYLIVAIGV